MRKIVHESSRSLFGDVMIMIVALRPNLAGSLDDLGKVTLLLCPH